MKIKSIIILLLMMLLNGYLMAQVEQHILDANTNGTTVDVHAGVAFSIIDEGGLSNNYTKGKDFSISFKGPCNAPNFLAIYFTDFDIASTDTFYVYDGPSTSSPLIIKSNNTHNILFQKYIYASASNVSNVLTIRLKTAANSATSAGFVMSADCRPVCDRVYPEIDSIYYRTRNGVVYDTSKIELVYDTDSLGDTISIFRGANLCLGDGIIFNGHILWDPNYATGHYVPTNENTNFKWNMGVDGDSLVGTGMNQVSGNKYNDIACYDVTLDIVDVQGCASTTTDMVRIRIAQNPIKTIFDLATICTGDTLVTSVGYDGDYTITLKKIVFSKTASKTNEVRTFIPDGPHCDVQCYSAPVDFTEFPSGKKITSKEEICSVCINYEHTFMGDYRLSLVCPNGSKAILKFAADHRDPQFNGSSPDPTLYPTGSYGGSGTDTGIPLRDFDGSDKCDSLLNPFGVGWNYCFSRNGEYTLIDGLFADTDLPGNHYLGNRNTVTTTVDVPPSPPYFNNSYPGRTENATTQDSSDHDGKTGYYMPWSNFEELVGCPMNGTWEVEVCDYWGADNGWVFSWSLDLCGISSNGGCEYQVGLDSLHWRPDTVGGLHYDNEMGKYRGLEVVKLDSIRSGITSPDTAGQFPLKVSLYDEFGCVWDTSTTIKITWTPRPELGDGGAICGDQFMVLDAKDHFTDKGNYTYMWDPYGQGTDTIHTTGSYGDEIKYVVEVYNTQNGVRCIGRDTTQVSVNLQPIPNFDMDQYPLEGCEPYTIHINNTSLDADSYRWEFGDGTVSTEKNPTHTYKTGSYDFKFYVYSGAGCKDSLIYDKLVTVFPSPDARFAWEPVYPTMTNPTIDLENRTVPDDPSMEYFWEIQYDKDYPYSYHTLHTKDSSFTWETDGEDISGDYIVRLIARSANIGPSGYPVYCSDTIENTVLILNDFLEFPNLITPNGDGVNDRFVIKNLISGKAYPTNCLDIYNKWGARVFHKENIAKDEDFWDPAINNTPVGTYFYHFTGRGYNGSVERNGSVEVLR